MTETLLLLIFNSLYIFGFYSATEYQENVELRPDPKDREILWFVKWYLRNAPRWVQKPVFGCVVCMASLHSWPFLLFNHELTLLNGATYIIYIFALSGFNAIVNERLSS